MAISYNSADELAQALRQAEAAHGQYENSLGHIDTDWPAWYAKYMAQSQAKKPNYVQNY